MDVEEDVVSDPTTVQGPLTIDNTCNWTEIAADEQLRRRLSRLISKKSLGSRR